MAYEVPPDGDDDLVGWWDRPARHEMPARDTIDHDASAKSPDDMDQCVCGPEWMAGGSPRHLIAVHRVLHGRT